MATDSSSIASGIEEIPVLRVTKELDWLPPRPIFWFPCVSRTACCPAPSDAYTEEFLPPNEITKPTRTRIRPDDLVMEEIPDLEMDASDDDDSSWVSTPASSPTNQTAGSSPRKAVSHKAQHRIEELCKNPFLLGRDPEEFRGASETLLQLAQIIFSMVLLDQSIGAQFRGRRHRRATPRAAPKPTRV